MESICKTVFLGDEKIAIPRLDLEDLFGICEEITAERMKDAETLGKADQLPKVDISNIKLDIKLKKVTIQELLALTRNPLIAAKVVRAAMTKGKVDKPRQSEILKQIPIPDVFALAENLILDEQEVPKKPDEVKENPLPDSGSSPSDEPATAPLPEAYGQA